MTNTTKNTDPNPKVKIENPDDYLPGAAIDTADDNQVDPKLVKQRTKRENNNPRNHDMF